MKTLKIDDKWSVEYNPEQNDRPMAIMRHGEACSINVYDWKNDSVAMFYALLEARRVQETVALVLPVMNSEQMEELRLLGQRTGGLVEVDVIPGKRKALDDAGDAQKLNLSSEYGRMGNPQFIPENPSSMVRTPNDFPSVARSLVKHDGFIAAFLNALTEEIHARNVRAGWWTDIDTGENTLHSRNVGEMLMLTVTEISEAMEADRKKLMDDKLPHRPGLTVELADAVIRILDLAGSRMAIERQTYDGRAASKTDVPAENYIHPFGTVFVEKLVYNANREDHKIENRRGPNGEAHLMDRIRNIIRFFTRWPRGVELLKIDQRGCMATDWHIIDRGRIVRMELRGKIRFYIVKRKDGTKFDAIVDRCNHNPDRECTRLAGEDLVGKIYESI